MSNPILEIDEVVYNTLNNDSTLGELINGVYDEPPTNQNYPYVTIGSVEQRIFEDLSHRAYMTTYEINIHTKPQGLGFHTSKKIADRINELLNIKKLTLTNHTMLMCRFVNATTKRNDNIRVITSQYEIVTDDNNLVVN